MTTKLIIFFFLLLITSTANAEYYVSYQPPKSTVINLNFSANNKHHYNLHTKKKRHGIRYCSCTPLSCHVPKQDIYTGSPTTCTTYSDVVGGQE